MTETEALALMALPKCADPGAEWLQHRTHAGLSLLAFGVTDERGAARRGMHIELSGLRLRRVAATAWKITLFAQDGLRQRRVYQIENPGRVGTRAKKGRRGAGPRKWKGGKR